MTERDYREKIVDMVDKISNLEFLENIYWFVKKLFDK